MDIALSLAYYCSATFVSVQIQANINVRLLNTEDFSDEWEVLDPDKGRPRFYFLTIVLIRHTYIL